MSKLNESIVEDAAQTLFTELGYAVGHGPPLAHRRRSGGAGIVELKTWKW
jgi:hypothetical protein